MGSVGVLSCLFGLVRSQSDLVDTQEDAVFTVEPDKPFIIQPISNGICSVVVLELPQNDTLAFEPYSNSTCTDSDGGASPMVEVQLGNDVPPGIVKCIFDCEPAAGILVWRLSFPGCDNACTNSTSVRALCMNEVDSPIRSESLTGSSTGTPSNIQTMEGSLTDASRPNIAGSTAYAGHSLTSMPNPSATALSTSIEESASPISTTPFAMDSSGSSNLPTNVPVTSPTKVGPSTSLNGGSTPPIAQSTTVSSQVGPNRASCTCGT